ncbi:MAG TPA: glycosyltransferase [Thermoanaerobaculia bacterium]|jgi:glycosyltransferase involved in cell wall biosynthesis|nr:glycosyltransferase [Thermoanaerobaculia bacterium]
MRLLHVVPTYVPAWRHGGPILAVHGLCRALVERGHEVTVLTTDVHGDGRLDVPLGEPVRVDGVEVWYFPVRWPRRLYVSPALGRAALRVLRGVDLLHLHSVFLWPTTAAARAAERAGVPYVVSPRGMLVPDLIARRGRWRKRAWMLVAERRTLERAAALHATSALEAEEAARLGLPLPPVFKVPNGVDLPSQDGVERREPFLLFLGRVSWKKGLDRLIPALAHCPGVELKVAGNDEEGLRPELERLAGEAGVAGRVVFLGPMAGKEKASLLRRAAILVLPSRSENFGNVVLEAMAAGCPVAVTPEVGLAETVRETGAGIVFDAADGDPARLGEALRDLMADAARRQEMGCRGARAAADRFGWPAVAREMEAMYDRILASGRGGSGRRVGGSTRP